MGIAHDGEDHSAPAAQPAPLPFDIPGEVSALPWEIGGPFELVDHTGAVRTQVDPTGEHQLLFFGYANCPGICSAAIPMMAQAVDILAQDGVEVNPVLLTIDPTLDTLETMGPALAEISEKFIGLTGEPEKLQVAYDAFQVDFEKLFVDPEYGPIYSHGAHIYLMSPEGDVLTMLPPILPAEQTAAIVKRYTVAAALN